MICKKCHKFKPKRIWQQHQRLCVPIKEDLEHYTTSKTGGNQPKKKGT